MDMSQITIYNVPPMPPNWDSVGIFYITFCATWTTIGLAGMVFCWFNRNLPILKVRGLPLAFGAVIFLHLYWIMAQIVYPIGATMPLVIAYTVQYFVMGIWFPLGIALYHASNLRFLHFAKRQRQFAHPEVKQQKRCNCTHSSLLCRFHRLEYTTKVVAYIGIGIVFQCLLTTGMWLACKKYHPSFGVPGTEIKGATLPEQLIDLGRGWEWWPTVVWQFVWCWMVAPYLIWESWDIHDTMGWRTQTIGTCLAGLHATPMFLIASYVPAFYTSKINAYFPPSQWIHLTTMFIEIFTVFIPAYQVIKLKLLQKQVNKSKTKWATVSDSSNIVTFMPSEKSSSQHLVEQDQILSLVNEHQGDRLLTMTALNRVLSDHPEPLQEFSAYHDFSGENIAFLQRVAKWQEASPKHKLDLGGDQRIDMYNAALTIYIDFISPSDAEFPLNVSSHHLKHLQDIFETSARILCGAPKVNPATPFAFEAPPSRESSDSKSTDRTLHARYTGHINPRFDYAVFDDVQEHIKNLVLLNTWPKFVREMQQKRRRSIDSQETVFSEESRTSVVSQLARFVKNLV